MNKKAKHKKATIMGRRAARRRGTRKPVLLFQYSINGQRGVVGISARMRKGMHCRDKRVHAREMAQTDAQQEET